MNFYKVQSKKNKRNQLKLPDSKTLKNLNMRFVIYGIDRGTLKRSSAPKSKKKHFKRLQEKELHMNNTETFPNFPSLHTKKYEKLI